MATLRIGVDVGGTNTDGVLLDPFATSSSNKGILAWNKSPTTPDPSEGIENVITTLLENAKVDASKIACISIGTTHFINAVVEKDRNRLAPVAVIRLCGPFSRDVYPGIDWPADLRDIICASCGFVNGGLEIDGELIDDVDESQVAEEVERIKEKGIKAIVINGVFSPADTIQKQEERVAGWVRKYYPEADVVMSKEVANLGFIERENAAMLNAAILPFARRTLHSFRRAIHRLNLSCPLFITQNDGTVLQAHLAARLPIRTFSSGPTNSMCGAAFLLKGGAPREKESMLVVDIGGTTTDVGMLLPNGLPRQAAAVTEVSGVRMNFSCPDVKSIGLGGGSIVRKSSPSAALTIGPDSVGHRIHQSALVFGGDTPTTTDYSVVADKLSIGPKASEVILENEVVGEYKAVVKKMLENIIDKMKTSAEDIPVLLVGGGVIIAPDSLIGASRVEKPEFAGVANAIGAAIARVSGTVDVVVSTTGRTTREVLEEGAKLAVDRAVENGAVRETVEIAEMDAIPLQYIADKCRIIIKAIGDFDFAQTKDSSPAAVFDEEEDSFQAPVPDKRPSDRRSEETVVDIPSYRPNITASREWIISETDLEWISFGCYILGTGGGGNPYPHYVRVREMMRKGAVIRVVSPEDLRDDDIVACGGAKGSPTVSVEKLAGDEMMEAQNLVYDHIGKKPDTVIALEIGGGNGLQGLLLGASTNMNIPTVDGDWMGRAYPVAWQITPVVWGGDKAQFLPTAISDGNGNTMIMLNARTEKHIERAFRAALSTMGSHVACAKGPWTGAKTKIAVVENTISLAWRIGRAVALCRTQNRMDFVADAIIDEVGGSDSAKVLFKGKIIDVERKTMAGHVYGEVTIASAGGEDEDVYKGKLLKIPFKNENILAKVVTLGQEEEEEEIIASVPDLICVSDAATGEAIGTPEYRYGLLVIVIGMQASPKWTDTPRGIEIGGPKAFGFNDVEYKPLGVFKKPQSVIDEFIT